MSFPDEKAGSEDGAEVVMHEQRTGWKGTYYHPLTQVNFLLIFIGVSGPIACRLSCLDLCASWVLVRSCAE